MVISNKSKNTKENITVMMHKKNGNIQIVFFNIH